jgi:hypothetical protein
MSNVNSVCRSVGLFSAVCATLCFHSFISFTHHCVLNELMILCAIVDLTRVDGLRQNPHILSNSTVHRQAQQSKKLRVEMPNESRLKQKQHLLHLATQDQVAHSRMRSLMQAS